MLNLSDCHEEYQAGVTGGEKEPGINPALLSLRLFPVKNKRPLVKGWQAAAPVSLCSIAEMEDKHPGCGWGAALDASTFVVDCDNEEAVSALCDLGETHGGFPYTLTTLTPRGFHFWFAAPDTAKVRNRVGVLPGIDVRTKGGFVVVPPSDGYVFADVSAPVANAPDWILRMVAGDGVPALPPEPVLEKPEPVYELSPFDEDVARRRWENRLGPGKVPEGRSPFALRIALEPQSVTKGTRNTALYSYLCHLRGEDKPEASIRSEAWRVVSRIPKPMSKCEVEKVIANALKHEAGAVGGNTLVDAWRMVEQIEDGQGATKWYRFLLLIEQLVAGRPETKQSILLPVRSIGTLMGAHYTQVGQWRRRAVEMGILSITSHYVRRRLADEFSVREGFSPASDGPALYKVKLGRKPKITPVELEQVA